MLIAFRIWCKSLELKTTIDNISLNIYNNLKGINATGSFLRQQFGIVSRNKSFCCTISQFRSLVNCITPGDLAIDKPPAPTAIDVSSNEEYAMHSIGIYLNASVFVMSLNNREYVMCYIDIMGMAEIFPMIQGEVLFS